MNKEEENEIWIKGVRQLDLSLESHGVVSFKTRAIEFIDDYFNDPSHNRLPNQSLYDMAEKYDFYTLFFRLNTETRQRPKDKALERLFNSICALIEAIEDHFRDGPKSRLSEWLLGEGRFDAYSAVIKTDLKTSRVRARHSCDSRTRRASVFTRTPLLQIKVGRQLHQEE
jgi:hypothetical protein